MLTLQNIISEMAYPTNFDMREFKSLSSFKKRIKYCKERLKYIGGGSARMVFKIDDGKCLKLARNAKGLAQNEIEATYNINEDVAAKVFDFDDNFLWVEMELAKKISRSEFEKLAGVSLSEYDAYLKYLKWRRSYQYNKADEMYNKPSDAVMAKCDNSEFVRDITRLLVNYDFYIPDFAFLDAYGRIGNRIVVVDYGVNATVMRNHYHQ